MRGPDLENWAVYMGNRGKWRSSEWSWVPRLYRIGVRRAMLPFDESLSSTIRGRGEGPLERLLSAGYLSDWPRLVAWEGFGI